MLAGVLLESHNTHHWLQFFAAAREAVAAGRLGEYRAALAAQKRARMGDWPKKAN